MHPMTIMAAGRQVEKERQEERLWVQLRSLTLANRGPECHGSGGASGFVWRRLAGISLRSRLS
jgi:hypothetical protein